MKWGTFVTPTMSYKILGTRNLKREIVSWLGKMAKLLFNFLFFFFYLIKKLSKYMRGNDSKEIRGTL